MWITARDQEDKKNEQGLDKKAAADLRLKQEDEKVGYQGLIRV